MMSQKDDGASDYVAMHDQQPTSTRGGQLRTFFAGLAVGGLVIGSLAFVWHANMATASPASDAPPSDAQSGRLSITNGCSSDPLWLANFAFQRPYFEQDIKLAAGETYEFDIPEEGLPATRFWAKWGCDDTGASCTIGMSGGPGEKCGEDGCAPPVDSKFEATFGCLPGSKTKCAVNPSVPSQPLGPTDWWDVSQVDGWTLPYKGNVVGDCPKAPSTIDCSRLSLDRCPEWEDLGLAAGQQTLRLLSKDKKHAVGCYAPCAKLTYSQWGQGLNLAPESQEARNFCCPTPPISPEECSGGPVVKTKYVQAVHELCPKVYAYAYDDGIGLAQCPAGTRYEVTFFCP